MSDEAAQFNRAIAANLPAPARGVAAQEAKRGGGIFQIKRMTYDDAAFEFYGWNKDMGRRTPQLIEVRKGNNSDMRIAVVREFMSALASLSNCRQWNQPCFATNSSALALALTAIFSAIW